ncbi:Germacrene A synthase [Sesamum angolense]|uniref:Germacrene A synthase n=1 Tax=Sesamum angolense TaxID=2727404 RepID=A0AAE1W186_9LAMI|nr:Germacrene A synthase [Sesamum angolense]
MAPAMTVVDDSLPSLPGKDVRPPITSYSPSMWGDAFTSFSLDDKDNYDLFSTALQFRLLRQHRYSVSCDVFNKFKDEDGEFQKTLTSDAKGLLSLYEAANVRIHGEDVLEDAVAFTSHHLNRMVQELEPPLQCQMKRALEQPVHRGETNCQGLQQTYAVVHGRTDAYIRRVHVNTVVTSCIYVFLTVGIPGLKSASKEAIDWVMSEPNKALIASTRVCRHADDIGSDERESRGGNIPTAVDCYAKQYGVSKEETVEKFKQLSENAWKDFNTEWSTEISTVSKDMMEQLLNYARAAEVNYRNGRDAYTHPQKIAGQIAAVFMHPIAI